PQRYPIGLIFSTRTAPFSGKNRPLEKSFFPLLSINLSLKGFNFLAVFNFFEGGEWSGDLALVFSFQATEDFKTMLSNFIRRINRRNILCLGHSKDFHHIVVH